MNLKLTMKPKTYNYYIMVVTATVLTAIGLVCLYGIGYFTIRTESMPNWLETPLYGQYIDSMNLYIYPLLVVLLVVLGLCIPKRIVPRHALLTSGAGILGLTIILEFIINIEVSLWFLLGISIVIQTAVMILTIINWGGLTFERDGYFIQVGSAMLHLGIVIFVFDFLIMRTIDLHLQLFWVATILITMGTVLSFYPEEIGRMTKNLRNRTIP